MTCVLRGDLLRTKTNKGELDICFQCRSLKAIYSEMCNKMSLKARSEEQLSLKAIREEQLSLKAIREDQLSLKAIREEQLSLKAI